MLSESKFQQIEHISVLQTPNKVSVMIDNLYILQRMIDYAKNIATTPDFKWNIFGQFFTRCYIIHCNICFKLFW